MSNNYTITDSVLEKLGFKWDCDEYVLVKPNAEFAFRNGVINVGLTGSDWGCPLPHIKTVSQLINLIYALTGESIHL